MDKGTIVSAETQKGREKAKWAGNFIARNFWLWIVVVYIVYPLATLFSAFTEGSHILLRMQQSYPDWLAYGLAGIMVLIIEMMKYITGKGAVDDLQAGVFTMGAPDRALFVFKVLTFGGCMFLSVYLSLSGVSDVANGMRKESRPVNLIDLAAIDAKYDAAALPHFENITAYKKTTWKGRIVENAQAMIKTEQRQIDDINERRNVELAEARAANAKTEEEYHGQGAASAKYITTLAGFGETVVVACLIFIGFYDDGVLAMGKKANQESHEQEAQAAQEQQGQNEQASVIAALMEKLSVLEARMAENAAAKGQPAGFKDYTSGAMGASNSASSANQPSPPPTPQASADRRPIGFQPQPVATGSYQLEAQEEDYSGQSVETLLQAWRNARSNRQAWEAKLRNGTGKPETNQRGIDKYQQRMSAIEKELESRGHDLPA